MHGNGQDQSFLVGDDEAKWLSSPEDSEAIMSCIPAILQHRTPLRVLDAFASVGGSTIYFMRKLPKGSVVHAVQVAVTLHEKARFRRLNNNIAECAKYTDSLPLQNVETFAMDIKDYVSTEAPKFRPDLLFADPPWKLNGEKGEISSADDLVSFMREHVFYDPAFRPKYIIFKMPGGKYWESDTDELIRKMLNAAGHRKYALVSEVAVRTICAYGYVLEDDDGHSQQSTQSEICCSKCGRMVFVPSVSING